MTDPAYGMQIAIAAALLADPATAAILGCAIYDPLAASGKPYPYAAIGDDEVVPCSDGMTDEVWSEVDVWASGPGGRLLAKQAGAAIRAVLAPTLAAPNLVVPGLRVISGVLHNARYPLQDDPTSPQALVARAQLQFRFQTVPTP